MRAALNAIFALLGLFVAVLWVLGSLGLGDFRLYFGPVGSINCSADKAKGGGNG